MKSSSVNSPSSLRRSSARWLVVASMLFTPLALAQSGLASNSAQGSSELDPVVVTAARFSQQLSDTLPSTSVITRSDIENSQDIDVVSLLRRQAGVEIGQSGGLGSVASVFMRGSNSDQVLVLIDGLRINSVSSGAAPLAHLMLAEIDHIEIVRGNVSSLYGSEAIGGVIQIFTRGSSGAPSMSVTAEVGGDRTRDLSVHGGGEFGDAGTRTRASITASTDSMKGFSAIDASIAPNANPDIDGYVNRSMSAKISQQVGEQEFGVRWMQSEGHLDFDDPSDYSYLDPTYNGRIQTHKEVSMLVSGAVYAQLKLSNAWSSVLQFGHEYDSSDNTSSYPFSDVIGSARSQTDTTSWNNTFAFAPGQTATAGVEHLDQKGDSSAYTNEFTRHVDSAFAGYDAKFGRQSIQLNAREDHYSDFGTATTGLIAYGFQFTPGWKGIAEASSAFKAPTFDDLYYPFFGNPDLKPERAHSVEAGAQYSEQKTYFRATVFRTEVHDLIVYDDTTFEAANIDRARMTGIEMSAAADLADWDVSGNLTLQRPIDAISDQELLRRATHNFNLSVARTFGAWRYFGDVQVAGARYDSDINTFARIQLPGYTLANFGVRYTFNLQTSVGFTVQNAFDRRYMLVDGYNTAGRVALVSLKTGF